jgi:predicted metal-binding membrane protein
MSAPASVRERVVGIPPLRRWSQAELLLAGLLLALAAVGWLLSGLLATPDMQSGVLTGAQPMGDSMHPWLAEAGLFLLTWMVMMAAMMLPSIVPFTVGVSRLMRTRGAGRGSTATMTLAYFLIWAGTGILAVPAMRGLQMVSSGPTELAVRLGAVVLLAAGVYQLTPLKRVCLRRCRSPLFLVMHHGQRATQSRWGALRAGFEHGAYCLGCCWALIAILLAAGAMSLVWMGAVAAVAALEKVSSRGESIGSALGGVLIAIGLLLLAAPSLLATTS